MLSRWVSGFFGFSYIAAIRFCNFGNSGDFNILFGSGSSDAVAMNNILDMFNLKQHVNFPTHKFGNTLDWLITSDKCNLINKIRSTDQMSDHSSFIATLNETAKLCQPKEKINYRSYRKFWHWWFQKLSNQFRPNSEPWLKFSYLFIYPIPWYYVDIAW